jgi:hypothetical protein
MGNVIQFVPGPANVKLTYNPPVDTTPDVLYQAYDIGDLIIQCICLDDDPTANNLQTPSAPPNGETPILDQTGGGGSTSLGPTQGLYAWVATSKEDAGSLAWTNTGLEDWAGWSLRVPKGRFDPVQPLGAISGFSGSGGTEDNFITTPSWTAGPTDGNQLGQIVVFQASDSKESLDRTPTPTGWKEPFAECYSIGTYTDGTVGTILLREAPVTNNEVIAATTDYVTDGSGTYTSTIGIIIRGVEPPREESASFVPPSLIQHRPPGVKPVGPVKADPMNPLTHGMIRGLIFQERAGHTTTDLSPLGGSCRVDDSVNPWGNAIDLGTAGQAVYLSGHNNYLSIVNWGSIMFRCRATETPVSNATIFVGGSVYTDFCIYRGSSNTVLQVCAGGVETGETVTTDLWDGDWHDVAFHWEVDVDQRYLWIDGSFEVTSSFGTMGNVDLSPGCALGEAGVDPSGMEFEYCYMWNRWIRKEFKEKIAADPYQMLIPANNF